MRTDTALFGTINWRNTSFFNKHGDWQTRDTDGRPTYDGGSRGVYRKQSSVSGVDFYYYIITYGQHNKYSWGGDGAGRGYYRLDHLWPAGMSGQPEYAGYTYAAGDGGSWFWRTMNYYVIATLRTGL